MNTESAITELLTLFGNIAAENPTDPLVREIAASISSGNRWFSRDNIEGSVFQENERRGIFLGLLDGKALHFHGEGSLATIAPPGAGKTQCHILPNLFLWNGPAIVLDIKGDLWSKTSAFRASLGPVYRFAPFEPERSHHYNPLSAIRTDPDLLWEDCTAVADLMVLPQASRDPFWEQSAQHTLAGFIAHVCRKHPDPNQRSMSEILDLAAGVGLESYMTAAETATDLRQLMRSGSSLRQMSENTRAGILTQLQTSLKSWAGGRIERVTSSRTGRRNRSAMDNATLYICVRPDEIEPALSLLRVFIGQHIRNLTSKLERNPKEVLFFLDEFPQLRHMGPIEEGISVGRSYGVRLWIIAQSLSQIPCSL